MTKVTVCSGRVGFSFSLYTTVGFYLFLFFSLALLFRSLFDPGYSGSVQYVSRNR